MNNNDWLEDVWMEVQNEIDYETDRRLADPQEEWLGTTMYSVDVPQN
jgi:phage terminase large subunit